MMYNWIFGVILNAFVVETSCQQLISTPLRVTKRNVEIQGSTDVMQMDGAFSLPECGEACAFRRQCEGIYYSKRYAQCRLLKSLEEYTIVEKARSSFVFVSRKDIIGSNVATNNLCYSCEECVYNKATAECEMKECPKFTIREGLFLGNRRKIGAKVKVKCPNALVMVNGASLSVCQNNGTWSSLPDCAWDCGEPRIYSTVTVDPGGTTQGSKRLYRCKPGFFLSFARHLTERNVTCHAGGTWSGQPRCVKDCYQPKTADHFNAVNMTGEGIADYNKRTYQCPDNYVILSTKNFTSWAGVFLHNRLLHRNSTTIKCNGVTGYWYDVAFKCVRDCADRPRPKNVKTFGTLYTKEATEIYYDCADGYAILENDTLTTDVSRVSNCNDEDVTAGTDGGSWTNSDFTCVLVCANPPQPGNIRETTYTYNKTITIVKYTCADGHVIFQDKQLTNEKVGKSWCIDGSTNWTSPDLTCVKDCGPIPDVPSAQSTTLAVTLNVLRVVYTCPAGFVIKDGNVLTTDNSKSIKCIDTGIWNDDFMCVRSIYRSSG